MIANVKPNLVTLFMSVILSQCFTDNNPNNEENNVNMIYLVSYSCCTKYDRSIIFHLIGSFSKFFDIDVRVVSDELCRTKGNFSIKNLIC